MPPILMPLWLPLASGLHIFLSGELHFRRIQKQKTGRWREGLLFQGRQGLTPLGVEHHPDNCERHISDTSQGQACGTAGEAPP